MGETIVKCPNCRGELIADDSQLYDGIRIECLNCGHKFTYTTRKPNLRLNVRAFDTSREGNSHSETEREYKAIGNGLSFTANGIQFQDDADGKDKGETFNDFCKRNLGFYNFYMLNKTFFMSQETLGEAWDRLCDEQDEYVEYIIAMFAEYAFAETDRRKLASIFTQLLVTMRDKMRHEFTDILDELVLTGFERNKVIRLRDELEAFAMTINMHQWEFNGYMDYKEIPKPKRMAIKNDLQDVKLASAFMVMFDAILCDVYSHGKLIMFWMMLNDYLITQEEGTIHERYGLHWRLFKMSYPNFPDEDYGLSKPHYPMPFAISFKSIENPFKR